MFFSTVLLVSCILCRWKGKLFGDISAVCAFRRVEYLQQLMEETVRAQSDISTQLVHIHCINCNILYTCNACIQYIEYIYPNRVSMIDWSMGRTIQFLPLTWSYTPPNYTGERHHITCLHWIYVQTYKGVEKYKRTLA